MSLAIGIAIGVFVIGVCIGWMVPQPEWAKNLLDKFFSFFR